MTYDIFIFSQLEKDIRYLSKYSIAIRVVRRSEEYCRYLTFCHTRSSATRTFHEARDRYS